MAVLCGSQGRKRPALGETASPGKSGIHSAPIFAAANRWLMGLLQRADEGIGPYVDAESHSPAVGADALIRPLVQATTTARAARSGCAAVGGFAAYGCGVPLAGKAERAEGGTSGTLVTEILGAPQRETVKEKLVKCVLAPRFSSAPAPRESTAKSAPHPAAPVGEPS